MERDRRAASGSLALKRSAKISILVALAIVLSVPARAAEVERCDCHALTAWTEDDGVPGGSVVAMVQALGRYLWLGTTDGLVRFDGFRFAPWSALGEPALPGFLISDLVASADGNLWVAFADVGAIARIGVSGNVRSYDEKDGLSGGPIWTILEDRSGTLWAGGSEGLVTLKDGLWVALASSVGLPRAEVLSLYEDRAGGLWIGSSAGIYRRAPGSARFELLSDRFRHVQDFAQDRNSDVWITDSEHVVRNISDGRLPALAPDVSPPVGALRLLTDRDGALWIAALGSGLLRLRQDESHRAGIVERFRYEQKFATGAAGGVRSLFADDEGNVWVGMRGAGLLRVSQTVFDKKSKLEGITSDGVRAIAAAEDGSVWVGTGHRVIRFKDGVAHSYPVSQSRAIHPLGSQVLLATADGVARFVDGRFEHVRLPPDAPWSRLSEMAADTDGDLWLCGTNGLTHWGTAGAVYDGAEWRKPCRAVLRDSRGRLWAGFGDGSLAVHSGSQWRLYTSAHGLARGSVVEILEDLHGSIWISTRGGLSLYGGDRFSTLAAGTQLPAGIVPLLLEDRQGSMWMGVASGAAIIRFTRHAFETAVSTKSPMSYAYYDEADGMNGQLLGVISPSGVLAADGRLWVSSGDGVVIVDPSMLPVAHTVKSPLIELAVVNGRSVRPTDDASLPPGTSSLDVHFTSVSLSAARRLRFRYALDPVDPTWVSSGDQRRVTYTNLRPGRYELRVEAESEGGGWSPESRWVFRVAPRFYQTSWFYGGAFACGLFTLWGGWRARLRRVRHEYELVAAERSRVGREIHDNLLQNCVAVGWELEVLASEIDTHPTGTHSDSLRRLSLQVRQCIHHARRSIWELRSPGLNGQELPAAIKDFANSMTAASSLQVSTTVVGGPRSCDAATEEQLLFIAMEAIRNAVRHAAADEVAVTVEYAKEVVTLTVRDNGCGFVLHEGGDDWHWGIKHMQERATRIQGRVAIESTLGSGTIVSVAAPYNKVA